MRKILRTLVDKDSLFEFSRKYGGAAITALARLDGWPVAVLASDPYLYGGGWTADASIKVTRFIDLANTFHLPVVNLVDVPGFLIGKQSRNAGNHSPRRPHSGRLVPGVRSLVFGIGQARLRRRGGGA